MGTSAALRRFEAHPARSVSGAIEVPGDKSISHRALMLSGIAEGTSEVTGFLASEDCLASLTAMRALGVPIEQPSPTHVVIHGVGLRGLRDAKGIARFEEFQWQPGIQNHGVELVAGGNVAATLHEFVLRIYRLGSSPGVIPNHVLKHHDVAGLPHGIIRFCGNNQSEGLKVGGHAQFAAMVFAN